MENDERASHLHLRGVVDTGILTIGALMDRGMAGAALLVEGSPTASSGGGGWKGHRSGKTPISNRRKGTHSSSSRLHTWTSTSHHTAQHSQCALSTHRYIQSRRSQGGGLPYSHTHCTRIHTHTWAQRPFGSPGTGTGTLRCRGAPPTARPHVRSVLPHIPPLACGGPHAQTLAASAQRPCTSRSTTHTHMNMSIYARTYTYMFTTHTHAHAYFHTHAFLSMKNTCKRTYIHENIGVWMLVCFCSHTHA